MYFYTGGTSGGILGKMLSGQPPPEPGPRGKGEDRDFPADFTPLLVFAIIVGLGFLLVRVWLVASRQ
jgi:hypothetical protein